MMRKLLLFFGLLVLVTGAHGADGTLNVMYVNNAVPGYTGSLEVVLSNCDRTYEAFQFDLTLPEGFTYTSYVGGNLLDGHQVSTSSHEGNMTRFTAYASPVTTSLRATSGTLLKVYFTVDASTAVGNSTATISNATFALNAVSYHPAQGDVNINVSKNLTLSEYDATAPLAVNDVNVTVERQLKPNVWNTLVLPFSMTNEQLKTAFGDDVLLGSFDGYTVDNGNIQVSFTSSETLTAHTPYIIKMSGEKFSFTVDGVNITTADNDLTINHGDAQAPKAMIGSYVPRMVPDKCLIIVNDQFKYSTGSSHINGFRAYFNFADFDYNGAARTLTIDFFDMTTGVSSVSRSTIAEGTAYSLGGQQVSESAKGVHIKDGKKVVIK